MVRYSISGVLIIPKWLIQAPGQIAILFGPFLELLKIDQIWTPGPIIYDENTLKDTRKSPHVFKTYDFYIFYETNVLGFILVFNVQTP